MEIPVLSHFTGSGEKREGEERLVSSSLKRERRRVEEERERGRTSIDSSTVVVEIDSVVVGSSRTHTTSLVTRGGGSTVVRVEVSRGERRGSSEVGRDGAAGSSVKGDLEQRKWEVKPKSAAEVAKKAKEGIEEVN